MKSNSWLYHYYMVQSRLQYNLAYGGQPNAIAALYPQMVHMISPSFAGFDAFNQYGGGGGMNGGYLDPAAYFPDSGGVGGDRPRSPTTNDCRSESSSPVNNYNSVSGHGGGGGLSGGYDGHDFYTKAFGGGDDKDSNGNVEEDEDNNNNK